MAPCVILVITRVYGLRATTIEGQNAFAPALCFAVSQLTDGDAPLVARNNKFTTGTSNISLSFLFWFL